MQLNEVRAVVSGGASGLGFAAAQRLIDGGARVALLDINDEQGAESARELGRNAIYLHADVTSESGIVDSLAAAMKELGGINVVINCAGILGAGRVLGKNGPMPSSQFEQTLRINLLGSFNLSKAAANLMQHNAPGTDGERGVIINTASVAAFEGQIGQAAYAASKAGLVGMTLPMARELARFGIRVMTIAPGIFLTPMAAGMPEEVQASLSAQIPFPSRLGKPSEFADAAAFIITNRYMNGECLRIDGSARLQAK
ncbi:MAG: SDR family NAD(P)-dependent oxidoreductase [Xanthomonadales bacterium]|nr:SDR family NAD(P)-dependent oxidoreductase [Xanthomonadales bacterium]MCB1633447.1 SDR family NAD(P)-dependent oxidoreductase [Xanthomonadales bacterium]